MKSLDPEKSRHWKNLDLELANKLFETKYFFEKVITNMVIWSLPAFVFSIFFTSFSFSRKFRYLLICFLSSPFRFPEVASLLKFTPLSSYFIFRNYILNHLKLHIRFFRCTYKKTRHTIYTKMMTTSLEKNKPCHRMNGGKACSFIKKETLTQVFSYRFCKISKNTFFTEHFRTTTSILLNNHYFIANAKFTQWSEAAIQICSAKKGVLRNFAKFTEKYLCQSLFLIKLQAEA